MTKKRRVEARELIQALLNRDAKDDGGIISAFIIIAERHDGEGPKMWVQTDDNAPRWQHRGLLAEAIQMLDQQNTYETILDAACDAHDEDSAE